MESGYGSGVLNDKYLKLLLNIVDHFGLLCARAGVNCPP